MKGKGTHQCDLFSQEELNIENHDSYAIMAASIDQWHAGIGLFYQESAKLRAIRAKNVLTCQHAFLAHVLGVLKCSRAHMLMCLMCPHAFNNEVMR